MRDLVDRKHSEEQIVRAATFARTAGMRQLKVYNVVGLPYEEDADIDELIRFTVELSRIIPVALGVAPFVAKRNTPLDGAPFAGIREVEAKLERLRRGLKGRAEVRPTSARWAWVEYMLAQCGPEAGLATMDAWKAGAGLRRLQARLRGSGLRAVPGPAGRGWPAQSHRLAHGARGGAARRQGRAPASARRERAHTWRWGR